MELKLEGKVALVTGANRGVGQAYVAELLKRGAAKVYAGARNPESLAATLALDPGRVVPLRLDVTRAEDIAAAKKKATEAEIDAKYQAWVATLSPARQAWEKTLQENLGGFYLPIHKRQKVAGQSNAWDFVADDPSLPRVLLIGGGTLNADGPTRRVLADETLLQAHGLEKPHSLVPHRHLGAAPHTV